MVRSERLRGERLTCPAPHPLTAVPVKTAPSGSRCSGSVTGTFPAGAALCREHGSRSRCGLGSGRSVLLALVPWASPTKRAQLVDRSTRALVVRCPNRHDRRGRTRTRLWPSAISSQRWVGPTAPSRASGVQWVGATPRSRGEHLAMSPRAGVVQMAAKRRKDPGRGRQPEGHLPHWVRPAPCSGCRAWCGRACRSRR